MNERLITVYRNTFEDISERNAYLDNGYIFDYVNGYYFRNYVSSTGNIQSDICHLTDYETAKSRGQLIKE